MGEGWKAMKYAHGAVLIAATAGAWMTTVTAAAADPVILSGSVSDAGSYSIGALESLGAADGTASVGSFTGVSLWSLLGGTASGSTSDVVVGSGKNAILRDYVLATGANGQQSLVSLGEIDPAFGGTGIATPVPIVAYSNNGIALATPELVIAGGNGGRSVMNLTSLSVAGVPAAPVGPGGVSTSFSVGGKVAHPTSYNLAGLSALPAVQLSNVSFFSGTSLHTDTYTGASLWTLLTEAGPLTNELTSYVLTTGSDGYEVLLSLAELDPAFGAPDDLVAYEDIDNPADFTTPGGGPDGVARTVFPDENKGGRLVSNIVSIDVASVPEPASALLLGAGVIALAWRRRPSTWPRRGQAQGEGEWSGQAWRCR
jgi:hypothetical protein